MLHPSKKPSRDFHKRFCRSGNDGQYVTIAMDILGPLSMLQKLYNSILRHSQVWEHKSAFMAHL